MVDLLRAERARARREREVVVADPALRGPGASVSEVDDGLALSFLCCHPSLSVTSQVALTLRAVGGLTTAQIAHAHGVDEATMGTRIGRPRPVPASRSRWGIGIVPLARSRSCGSSIWSSTRVAPLRRVRSSRVWI
ncbi:sigma factor-like helix-turn-helix DNA-binding protein [Nocardiopsis alba]|uniref:sigma factor-like helix-turn-helix DNA-binding protein n=1 Tax=Nocardiopsis alba TaxID=53437 RepID=UPI001F28D19D|nr:sigma factor-like helix-turn-helix DNA-binding protein [Nocardiopsis alba]